MDTQPRKQQEQQEMDQVIAEALGNIKLYVETGNQEAFIQIKQPQLTRFQLIPPPPSPPPGTDQAPALRDGQNLMGNNVVEATALDRWDRSEVMLMDRIKEEERQLLGKTLTDDLTGEQYMLLPIDIDILFDPDTLPTPVKHVDKEVALELPSPGLELGQDWHKFTIPKLNLNFEVVLETEADGQTN